jgi:hypothetical protein
VYRAGVPTIGEALTTTITDDVVSGFRAIAQQMILYGDPALPMNPPALVQAAEAVSADDPLAGTASRLLALHGPTATADAPKVSAAAFSIRLVSEDPASTEARLEVSLPGSLATEHPSAAVFDLAGRQVRALDFGATRTLSWDLRDDADSPVGSGVYFVRVSIGGRATTRRINVVR